MKRKKQKTRYNSGERNKVRRIRMKYSEWREKYMYPVIGILITSSILYYNYFDQFTFEFPLVLWQKNMGFVGVSGTHFVLLDGANDENSKVYVNGWNSYWLMEGSQWGPSKAKVSRMLKMGSQMGMTVCRTWAFNDGPGPNSLQISPGVFNHKVLKGLDYVIVEARKHGVRLILSLANNLNVWGGKAQYVKWAQEAGVNVTTSTDSFFADPTIKAYYKAYIKAIITRKNSLSGVKYSEEPAIFAWELINEPRCDSNSSSLILQAWITEMAAYVKSLDQKHLLTVGLEGFYGSKAAEKSTVNPGEWAASLGTDFIQNSAIDGIDFASVHAYPDSWIPHADAAEKMNFISKWLDSHISDGDNILKKPVLFTEIGCPSNLKGNGVYNRDTLFKTVYDRIVQSAKKGEAGAGALIWQLLVEDMDEYGDQFSLIAWKEPFTYHMIVEQSCKLRNIFWKTVTGAEPSRKNACSGLMF